MAQNGAVEDMAWSAGSWDSWAQRTSNSFSSSPHILLCPHPVEKLSPDLVTSQFIQLLPNWGPVPNSPLGSVLPVEGSAAWNTDRGTGSLLPLALSPGSLTRTHRDFVIMRALLMCSASLLMLPQAPCSVILFWWVPFPTMMKPFPEAPSKLPWSLPSWSWVTCVHACVLSRFRCVQLFVALWTVAHQAPLFMGFSRQVYWSELPCPPPGDLPNPGIKPLSLKSPALAGRFLTTSATWEAQMSHMPAPKSITVRTLQTGVDVQNVPGVSWGWCRHLNQMKTLPTGGSQWWLVAPSRHYSSHRQYRKVSVLGWHCQSRKTLCRERGREMLLGFLLAFQFLRLSSIPVSPSFLFA